MSDCEQITLLLGAFEDGELEPHEMQEVARHLAACKSCEELLGDYNVIGRELRELITIPPLTGFAAGVDARIAALRPPLSERIAAAFAMVSMAGAVAVITALVLTPYLRNSISNGAANTSIAKVEQPPAAAPSLASAVTDENARSVVPSEDEGQQVASTPNINPGDSHAVIKRLESQIPTTAVWSEPENGTTVIWLPSDQ
jgi:anti-sigma factor RsiW